MPRRRTVSQCRLKLECVEEYIRRHQQVWPELLEAYRKAGITQISCFLHDLDLLVYSEFETEVYEKAKDSLARDPIETRWQAMMESLRDPAFENHSYDEVFYMPPEHNEKLA